MVVTNVWKSYSYILNNIQKEVKRLLHVGQESIPGVDLQQKITLLDTFACALPPNFLCHFKE